MEMAWNAVACDRARTNERLIKKFRFSFGLDEKKDKSSEKEETKKNLLSFH
jgi:hypothetical protein